MSRKPVVPSYAMINAVSMGASITSNTVNVLNLDQASILVEWSAGSTPVGVLTVEARNGEKENWYELDFNSVMSVSGNTGSIQIVFNQMPFTDIRLKYTRTSGSGTMDATITMKNIGA